MTYVPNAGEGLKRLDYRINEWDHDFHEYLNGLADYMYKPIIVTGDFNVAHRAIDIYDETNKEKTAGYTPQERHSID